MADVNKKYLTASDDVIKNKYTKPSSGIPASDLAQAVQNQLVWEKGDGNNNLQVKGADANATGDFAVAEGMSTFASGEASHVEGDGQSVGITASGRGSHAEGYEDSTDSGIVASGKGAHAEGCCSGGEGIVAGDDGAHAGGYTCGGDISAFGAGSFAHGWVEDGSIQANGNGSHVEGFCQSENGSIVANSDGAHAEGYATDGGSIVASGQGAHAEGINTIAQNGAEHAEGKYNKSNKKTNGTADQNAAGSTIHSVGCGDSTTRKNAFEIMQNGDVYVKGVGGYDGTNAGVSGVFSLEKLLGNILYSEDSYIVWDTDSVYDYISTYGYLDLTGYAGLKTYARNYVKMFECVPSQEAKQMILSEVEAFNQELNGYNVINILFDKCAVCDYTVDLNGDIGHFWCFIIIEIEDISAHRTTYALFEVEY